ncbi:hypothetical protein C3B51_17850 [Pseudoalteromonas rubra]|uniref:Chitin-binding type-2 domain-containing protein n=1 Tax=Pseudoalteromonas rubra TaxID=43658 RepID=A0A4Q7E1Z9_9GAMM|nr:hypothetical protein [Pseudoalteromonas rubra]RZM76429.1 hypothetical protein C3B51_17850 [Pseudoalteromonas rubra]
MRLLAALSLLSASSFAENCQPTTNLLPIVTENAPSGLAFVQSYSQMAEGRFLIGNDVLDPIKYRGQHWLDPNGADCPQTSNGVRLNSLVQVPYIDPVDNAQRQKTVCIYMSFQDKYCPDGYTIDLMNKDCILSDSSQCNNQCSDGFPPDLLGYPGCDRPPIQQCSDGSYRLADAICPVDIPDPDPNPDPTPNPDIDLSGLIQKIEEFRQQENHSGEQVIDKLTDLSGSVRQSGDSVRDGINAGLINQTQALSASIGQLNDDNKLRSDLLRDSVFQLNTAVRDLQAGNAFELDLTRQSIQQQTDALSPKIDSTNSKLDATNQLLNSIKQNTEPKPGESCVPSIENNYCENPHGITTAGMKNIFDTLGEYFDGEITGYQSNFETKINEFSQTSPLGNDLDESAIESLLSYFTDVIPQATECRPLTLFDYQGKRYEISCAFSTKFKELFAWILGVYTIFNLINILTTGIVPRGTPAKQGV